MEFAIGHGGHGKRRSLRRNWCAGRVKESFTRPALRGGCIVGYGGPISARVLRHAN